MSWSAFEFCNELLAHNRSLAAIALVTYRNLVCGITYRNLVTYRYLVTYRSLATIALVTYI